VVHKDLDISGHGFRSEEKQRKQAMKVIVAFWLIFNLLHSHVVTWQQLVTFLEKDHTNWEAFTPDHSCEAFAHDLENAAQKEGFLVWRVRVDFENGAAHIFDAFQTSDLGDVYIEPQNDERYTVPEVGGYLCYIDTGSCWTAKGMKIVQVTTFDKDENSGSSDLVIE
jgi:hypothetical protein